MGSVKVFWSKIKVMFSRYVKPFTIFSAVFFHIGLTTSLMFSALVKLLLVDMGCGLEALALVGPKKKIFMRVGYYLGAGQLIPMLDNSLLAVLLVLMFIAFLLSVLITAAVITKDKELCWAAFIGSLLFFGSLLFMLCRFYFGSPIDCLSRINWHPIDKIQLAGEGRIRRIELLVDSCYQIYIRQPRKTWGETVWDIDLVSVKEHLLKSNYTYHEEWAYVKRYLDQRTYGHYYFRTKEVFFQILPYLCVSLITYIISR